MGLLIGPMRFIIAFVVATALFWGGLLFERRPHGWPNIHVGFFTLHLPDGPWARLEAIDKLAATQAAHNRVVAVRRAQVSEAIGLGEAKAQETIRYVTRTQIKEIPTYVTPEIDRAFRLPIGLIRLHDAAARGVGVSDIPLATGQSDDSPSDVKASDLAGALVTNYGACRADDEQLSALQDWMRQQAAIK